MAIVTLASGSSRQSGGFNVCPREIEEVLLTHPAVSLAAVVGVPHASYGEEVKAFIIRKADAAITEGS
jgi:long-chain acyl-CoA synthetase